MLDLERPFHRLIHHYVMRIFYGAGDGDDLQFSIPALLGLLSVPSAFGALQLLGKYSTLRMFMLGIRDFDPYRASVSDEYFFIVYSLAVTGSVVILKWDRLFPDRQDYDNLAALPLSARQNFMASLTALLFLASLFAAVINIAAAVIFPYAVTESYNIFWLFVEFVFAHLLAVMLASLFTCFALLLLMGLTILVTPKRYVRTASLAMRILCAIGLIGVVGTAFKMPAVLLSKHVPAYAAYVPPVWFLDLHQMLLGRGTPLTDSGVFCLQITAITIVLSLAIYALTYYREYVRIPERGGLPHARGRDSYSPIRKLMDAVVLRTPFQRGTFYFTIKTLFRSERHCLLFGTVTAFGFFIAAQTAGEVLAQTARDSLDPRLLSISLTLSYFIIVGLRALFDLPSDRNASWVFRTTVDLDNHEGREVASKVMVAAVVPCLLLMLPVYAAFLGWATALMHTVYVLLCSVALSKLLLLRFQKIPFTCTFTASKDRVLVMILLGLLGFAIFSGMNASREVALLRDPIRCLAAIPWFALLFWWFRHYQNGLLRAERTLIFEDRPNPVVQVLNLTK